MNTYIELGNQVANSKGNRGTLFASNLCIKEIYAQFIDILPTSKDHSEYISTDLYNKIAICKKLESG